MDGARRNDRAATCCLARRPFLIWEAAWLTLMTMSDVCDESSGSRLCTSALLVAAAAAERWRR